MTLGPTILLPPLYEIQRNVQNIHEKYGSHMFLNVLDLDSDHQNQVRVWGGAPRAVVFGFLSLLSEQLFRFNMLKATIKEEERLKKKYRANHNRSYHNFYICWRRFNHILCDHRTVQKIRKHYVYTHRNFIFWVSRSSSDDLLAFYFD